MKRFLIFAYDMYYPVGGRNDEQASFDTLEEALLEAEKLHHDSYDILDLENREWVACG
jgi:hypothetical protein